MDFIRPRRRLADDAVAQSIGFVLPHILAVHSFVIGCIYVAPYWLRVGVSVVAIPLSASFCLQTSARQWCSPCTHQRERPVLAHPHEQKVAKLQIAFIFLGVWA